MNSGRECHSIDRRAFLTNSSMLAVGALLAGACGDGQIGNSPSSTGAAGTVTVKPGDYAALAAVGGIARISGTTRPVALVRTATGEYRAFSMVCTHQGTIIDIVNGGTSFRCPNHGATFASTGRWTGGQLTTNLVELTVTGDAAAGTLTVNY